MKGLILEKECNLNLVTFSPILNTMIVNLNATLPECEKTWFVGADTCALELRVEVEDELWLEDVTRWLVPFVLARFSALASAS